MISHVLGFPLLAPNRQNITKKTERELNYTCFLGSQEDIVNNLKLNDWNDENTITNATPGQSIKTEEKQTKKIE